MVLSLFVVDLNLYNCKFPKQFGTQNWSWLDLVSDCVWLAFCRFSHASLMVDNELVLVGGVSNECPPPGCTVINLDSKQCIERPLAVSNECPPPGCNVSVFSSRSTRGKPCALWSKTNAKASSLSRFTVLNGGKNQRKLIFLFAQYSWFFPLYQRITNTCCYL